MTSTQKHIVVAHNRNLIEYFARLSLSGDDNESINLEYVETVLKNGADIDCTDKYGQSIFHEVRLIIKVGILKASNLSISNIK